MLRLDIYRRIFKLRIWIENWSGTLHASVKHLSEFQKKALKLEAENEAILKNFMTKAELRKVYKKKGACYHWGSRKIYWHDPYKFPTHKAPFISYAHTYIASQNMEKQIHQHLHVICNSKIQA